MRAWFFVALAGLVLAGLGQIDAVSPAVGAALAVASSVALALLAHGGGSLSAHAVVMGASGALAYEALRPYLPLVASGVLLTFIFATRAMRARSVRELVMHLGAAFLGGVAASWVASFRGTEVTLWLAAVTAAALLASVPWLLPADSPRAHTLRRLARRARGALRVRILRALAAHRRLAALPTPPARATAKRIDAAFDELTSLCERRLSRGTTNRSDARIQRAVDQLVRVSRAATSRAELLDGLAGGALATLPGQTDELEAEVSALAEVE